MAVGAGFVEGLKYGDNTKAAVIRLGLMEMGKFIEEFYQSNSTSTYNLLSLLFSLSALNSYCMMSVCVSDRVK